MSTVLDKINAIYQSVRKEAPAILNRKGEVVELFCYGELGTDITAEAFAKAVADAKGARELHLMIQSIGGSVFSAKAMMANLERFDGKVIAFIDGLAASAASFLMLASDEIRAYPESVIMIHLPNAMAAGNADDFRQMADLLDKETESLVRMYSDKCGSKASPEKIRSMLEAETFFNASEAKAIGLVDTIIGEETPASKPKASKPSKMANTLEDTQRILAAARMNIRLLKEKEAQK